MAIVKPRLFIGSSSAAYAVALQFKTALDNVAEVVPWRRAPEWRSMWSTLECLVDAADSYDFGLFIFAADDDSVSDHEKRKAVRDNVLLELGMFLGSLGRDRTFGVMEEAVPERKMAKMRQDEKIKTPSDLLGIQLPRFKRRGVGSQRSIGAAAAEIAKRIVSEGRRKNRIDLVGGWRYCMETKEYSATIPALRLQRKAERLKGNKLLLVCRVRDASCLTEDDARIAKSSLRNVPTLLAQDLVITVQNGKIFRHVQDGDVIEGHLLLVPKNAGIGKARTLAELVAAGCDLVDSKAKTARARCEGAAGSRA